MNPISYGDIYLVNYSLSVGHEYQKIRPAVIISPDALLKRANLFTCIAITSKTAKMLPDDISLPKTTHNKLHDDSIIKMHHITSFDKSRIHKYIGKADNSVLLAVEKRIKEMFEIN